MTQDEAFLQSIIEAPSDDTPRLIYADWLEENGDAPRAEFIRLQCRMATTRAGEPEHSELLDREWELLTVYRKRWQPVAHSVLAAHLFESAFIRGFFARVNIPAAVLLEHGEELFRTFPLEELRIRDLGRQLGEMVRQPWLSQVMSLDLSHNELTLDDLHVLFDSPHLTQLRRLGLRNVSLNQDGMERLARWPGLRQITGLDLGNDRIGQEGERLANRPGPGGLASLIESPRLLRLESLSLADTALTEADLACLANSSRLPLLSQLRLPGCSITVEGVWVLGRAQGLPGLRHLAMGWNGYSLGDEGNASLVGSPLLARLDTLDLYNTEYGPRTATALAGSPYLGQLRCLDLSYCSVGPEEARKLASARFGALAELKLCGNKIGPEGMAALARAPALARLTLLDLLDNEIGPEGARVLAASPALASLQSLELARNWIGPDGAKALAGSPFLSRLRHLSLWRNDIGARAARTVMLSPHLARLWSLDLSDSNFTDATAGVVAASTPLHQLRRLVLARNERFTEQGERVLAASSRLPYLLHLWRWDLFGGKAQDVSPILLEHGKGCEL
jgi:uncharacterized protein (TIGR02996 family)